jgi:hypothetical protein
MRSNWLNGPFPHRHHYEFHTGRQPTRPEMKTHDFRGVQAIIKRIFSLAAIAAPQSNSKHGPRIGRPLSLLTWPVGALVAQ